MEATRRKRDRLREQLTIAQADLNVLAPQIEALEIEWQTADEHIASLERQVQAVEFFTDNNDIKMPTTAGSNTAVAPMLFIKADMVPQASIMMAMSRGSLLPARRVIRSPSMSATPVLNNPAETM